MILLNSIKRILKSQKFMGVAELMSNINPGESFKYWWEGGRFFGLAKVNWLYIKDVPDSMIGHLRMYTNFLLKHKLIILY